VTLLTINYATDEVEPELTEAEYEAEVTRQMARILKKVGQKER
jgi:hypothetical protein